MDSLTPPPLPQKFVQVYDLRLDAASLEARGLEPILSEKFLSTLRLVHGVITDLESVESGEMNPDDRSYTSEVEVRQADGRKTRWLRRANMDDGAGGRFKIGRGIRLLAEAVRDPDSWDRISQLVVEIWIQE